MPLSHRPTCPTRYVDGTCSNCSERGGSSIFSITDNPSGSTDLEKASNISGMTRPPGTEKYRARWAYSSCPIRHYGSRLPVLLHDGTRVDRSWLSAERC